MSPDEIRKKARDMRATGARIDVIATQLKVNATTITKWVRGVKKPKKTLEEAFWAYVPDRPKGEQQCWIWEGPLAAARYGALTYNKRRWYAHRLSWFLAHNEEPGSNQVLHRCDVELCIRPEHLFLGDDLDNAVDKARKGRARGVLSLEQVQMVVDTHTSGDPSRGTGALAKELGVSPGTIQAVITGRTRVYAGLKGKRALVIFQRRKARLLRELELVNTEINRIEQDTYTLMG